MQPDNVPLVVTGCGIRGSVESTAISTERYSAFGTSVFGVEYELGGRNRIRLLVRSQSVSGRSFVTRIPGHARRYPVRDLLLLVVFVEMPRRLGEGLVGSTAYNDPVFLLRHRLHKGARLFAQRCPRHATTHCHHHVYDKAQIVVHACTAIDLCIGEGPVNRPGFTAGSAVPLAGQVSHLQDDVRNSMEPIQLLES